MSFRVMDKRVLARAIHEHQANLMASPEQAFVTDEVRTPFAMAMAYLGFRAVIKEISVVVERCRFPDCNSEHATLFIQSNAHYWGCPYCKRISDA